MAKLSENKAAIAARKRRAERKAIEAMAEIQRAPIGEINVGDTAGSGGALPNMPGVGRLLGEIISESLSCAVSGAQLPESSVNKLFRLLAEDACLDQEAFLRTLLMGYVKGFPRRILRAQQCGLIK